MTLMEPSREVLSRLAGTTDEAGFIPADAEALQTYLVEPRDRWQGRAAAVLRPRTTEQVASIIRLASEARVGVVPLSGGTGLVGGQTMGDGPMPVLLSLERMSAVRAVLPEDAALIAEAGAILADIQSAAAGAGWLFPLAMASQGSCRIGGNLATNAGGIQVLRYGNARDLCLGVEAVMADGSVHHGLHALRKDNAGYDLRHLLIGSEGTLGVITAAVLRLFPQPGEILTAMLAVPDPATALRLLHVLRDRLSDGITAFELIERCGPSFVARFYPDWRDPLPGRPVWRVLLEASGPADSGLTARTEAVLADVFEAGLATDGAVAQSEAQRQAMWWLRETLPEVNRRVGGVSHHDLSVPMGRIAQFIDQTSDDLARIDSDLRINCFGHVGDGNLHYNVFAPEGAERAAYLPLREAIKRTVHDRVHALGGSVAAEHGVGRMKIEDLARYGDPAKLAAMRAIKAALDPHGILNPGAVLPPA